MVIDSNGHDYIDIKYNITSCKKLILTPSGAMYDETCIKINELEQENKNLKIELKKILWKKK